MTHRLWAHCATCGHYLLHHDGPDRSCTARSCHCERYVPRS